MEEYLELEEDTIDMKEPISHDIVCSACLSNDRDLYCINNIQELHEMFQVMLYDIAPQIVTVMSDDELYVCWECQALLERFCRFKWQVRSAQEYIQGLANGSITETLNHTYITKRLSSLDIVHKTEYDRTYIDDSDTKQEHKICIISTIQPIPVELKPVLAPKIEHRTYVKPEIIIDTEKLPVKSEIIDTKVTPVKSEQVPSTNPFTQGPKTTLLSSTMAYLASNGNTTQHNPNVSKNLKDISSSIATQNLGKVDTHYITERMTEDEMYKSREISKLQPQYLDAPYKCMLCITGLGSQEMLEEHFMTAHRSGPGQIACQICHKCVDEGALPAHTHHHYLRHMCKHCAHVEHSVRLIRRHVKTHGRQRIVRSKRERNGSESSDMSEEFPSAGTKRIKDSYPCPECDMVFKLARMRRTHIDRHHREGIKCDNCKRRFVNKTTLIEHLRLFCPVLHPGPPPQEACPICHKMVRVAYLKGHIRRHQNKITYECKQCNKTFRHHTNYKGHLKYSRVHATEFKYRCPMCEKGYSSKAIMQDHFNYQHLGKTSHKCSVCDKPLASRRCVIQHMRRAHDKVAASDDAPNICLFCGRGFKCARRLREHTRAHTGELCGAAFRRAASLHTHRRGGGACTPSRPGP